MRVHITLEEEKIFAVDLYARFLYRLANESKEALYALRNTVGCTRLARAAWRQEQLQDVTVTSDRDVKRFAKYRYMPPRQESPPYEEQRVLLADVDVDEYVEPVSAVPAHPEPAGTHQNSCIAGGAAYIVRDFRTPAAAANEEDRGVLTELS